MRLLNFAVAAAALSAFAAPAAGQSRKISDIGAVQAVLGQYKAAVEKLDPRGTDRLFTADSQIFEAGGSEGTYANYLQHHLAPELAEFRSFKFFDYKASVRLEGRLALATETYRFRIEPKAGEAAERAGVTTSVLLKTPAGWKIISLHSSARRTRPS